MKEYDELKKELENENKNVTIFKFDKNRFIY